MIKFLLDLIKRLFFIKPAGSGEEILDSPKKATEEHVNIIAPPPKPKPKPVVKKVIVIDPGHGGTDPGTVYRNDQTGELIAEKDAALAVSLTLKYLLSKKGYKVYLTRTDDTRPSYSHRTTLPSSVDADAFISIHFNMPKSYGLVYYAAEKDRPKSKKLARIIDNHMGFSKIWPSTASRFGRLYIDNVRYDIPSVLVEVDSIDEYKDSKSYRIKKAQQIIDALEEFFAEEKENG